MSGKAGAKAKKDDPNSKMSNIFKNPFGPLITAHKAGKEDDTTVWAGFTYNVASEVVVETLVRKMARMPRPMLDTVATHAISQGFHGGLYPWGKKGWTVGNNPEKDKYSTAFKDGFKGVPAVLVSAYIVALMRHGWFIPKRVAGMELLLMAATKSVTRPMQAFLNEYMPEDAVSQSLIIDRLYNRQREVSNFKSKDKKPVAPAVGGGAKVSA